MRRAPALSLLLLAACPEEPPNTPAGPPADAGYVSDASADAGPDAGLEPPELVLLIEVRSLSAAEGGAPAELAVRLHRDPIEPVELALIVADPSVAIAEPAVLGFDSSDFDRPKRARIRALDDDDTRHESTTIEARNPRGRSITVQLIVTDDDRQSLRPTATALRLLEAGTATAGVRLGAEPDGELLVTLFSARAGTASVAPAQLRFDASDWRTPKPFTVFGVPDDDVVNDRLVLRLAAPAVEPVELEIEVVDDDVQNLTSSPAAVEVREGVSGAIVEIGLVHRPAGPVTVALGSSDPAAAVVLPELLVLQPGDWPLPGRVVVSGISDDDGADELVTITASAAGLAPARIEVRVSDDDVQGILIQPPTLRLREGERGSFGVRLAINPLAPFDVSLAATDPSALVVSPSVLSFDATSWMRPATVELTALQDLDGQSVTLSVRLSAAGVQDRFVSVDIEDDDQQALIVSPTSLDLVEGSTASFALRLAIPPPAEVFVALSPTSGAISLDRSALVFTPNGYAAPQTIVVRGVEDPDLDDERAEVRITAVGTASVGVALVVRDDDRQQLLVDPTQLRLREDGAPQSFELRLAFRPPGPVDVNIAADGAASVAPSSVRLDPADYAVPRIVRVTPLEDDDTEDARGAIVVSAAGLGERRVSVEVLDDDPQALILDRAALSLREGDGASVSARLAFRPSGPLHLRLATADPGAARVSPSAIVFDPSDWRTPRVFRVDAEQDADLRPERVEITVSATTAVAAALAVEIEDDDRQAVIVDRRIVVGDEGGSETIMVSLAHQPAGIVRLFVSSDDPAVVPALGSLSLDGASYSTPRAVRLDLPHDPDLADARAAVRIGAVGIPPAAIEVHVADDDAQRLLLDRTALTMDEGSSAAVSVGLAAAPEDEVVVFIRSADPRRARPARAAIRFSPQDWASPRIVGILAPDDADVAPASVRLTIGAPGLAERELIVTVRDDDGVGLRLGPATLEIGEGRVGRAWARLSRRPSSDVVVAVSSADPGVLLASPSVLLFSAASWDTPAPIDLSAAEDADALDGLVSVSLAAAGLPPAVLVVGVVDDEAPNLVFEPPSVALSEAGGPVQIGVRLSVDPGGPVDVALSSSDATRLELGTSTLRFDSSNYAQLSLLTLRPRPDADAEDQELSIRATAPSLAPRALRVLVEDGDRASISAPSLLSMTEGETVELAVSLSAAPAAPTAVSVTPLAPGLSVTPAALLFDAANWSSPSRVSLRAQDDADVAGATVDVVLAGPGLDPVIVEVRVADDDRLALDVDPSALDLDEGGSATLGVRLAFAPAAPVRVGLRTDPSVALARPSSLLFDATNWSTRRVVTVDALPNLDALDATSGLEIGAPGLASVLVGLRIRDLEAPALVLDRAVLALDEGGAPGFVTVRLDRRPRAAMRITVEVADRSLASASPSALDLAPDDWARPRVVRVDAVHDPDQLDGATRLVLGGDLSATVELVVRDDDRLRLAADLGALELAEGSATSFNLRLTSAPSADVVVDVESADSGAVVALPRTLIFTPASFAAPQRVNVTALQDLDADDARTTLVIRAPALSPLEIPVLVADDERPGLLFETGAVSLDEGGAGGISLRLSLPPAAPVTVAIASTDPARLVAAPAELLFDPSNWRTPQRIALTAPHDDDASDDRARLLASAPGHAVRSAEIHLGDDDRQALLLGGAPSSLAEGAEATLTVSLAFRPRAEVRVRARASDPSAIEILPDELFLDPTDFGPRTLRIRARADGDAEHERVELSFSADGLERSLSLDLVDDDAPGLAARLLAASVREGERGALRVSLAHRPARDLVVALDSADPTRVRASPATLRFGPEDWDVEREVALIAPHDPDLRDDSVRLTLRAPGLAALNLDLAVRDDDRQRLVLDPIASTLVEGELGALSLRLGFEPDAPYLVDLASGDPGAASVGVPRVTFTPADWATPRVLTLVAEPDVDLVDESTRVLATALGVETATAAIVVLDDDEQRLVLEPAILALTEGSTLTVAVSLAFEPPADVAVSLRLGDPRRATIRPSTLLIPRAAWAAPVEAVITALDDLDDADQSIALTVEALDLAPIARTLRITDDDAQSLIVAPASLRLGEGQSGSFTVRLAFAPLSTLSVRIASSDSGAAGASPSELIFAAADFDVPRVVTVRAADDEDTVDEAADLIITAPGLAPRTVRVEVDDDDEQAIVLDATSFSLGEGRSEVFSIRLAYDPVSLVTVSVASSDPGALEAAPRALIFTSADYALPRLVSLSALDDDDIADEAVTLTVSAPGAPARSLPAVVLDDDLQRLVVSPDALAILEGGAAPLQVSLAYRPIGDMEVRVESEDPARVVPSEALLRFTPGSFAIARSVVLEVRDDPDLLSEELRVFLRTPGVATATITVSITDDDAQAIVATPALLSLSEGSASELSVRLAFAPSSTVTVNVQSSNVGVAWVDRPTLRFTPAGYATPQLVRVSAPRDEDLIDAQASLVLSATAVPPSIVNVEVRDADRQAFVLSPTQFALREGRSATVAISLRFVPPATLPVSLSASDPGAIDVSPSSLVFTPANYASPQLVQLGAREDDDASDEAGTISVGAQDADSALISYTIADDEVQGIIANPSAVELLEGGTTNLGVRLAYDPVNPITLTLTSGDPALTLGATTLSFDSTNYAAVRLVSLLAAHDLDLANRMTRVTIAGPGVDPSVVEVLIRDDDVQRLVVTPGGPLVIAEGGEAELGATLAFIPSGTVAVDLTSSDPGALGASPGALLFSPTDWNLRRAITVRGVPDLDPLFESTTITFGGPTIANVVIGVQVIDDDDVIDTYFGPGPARVVGGRLSRAGDLDTIRVELSAPSYLFAAVEAPYPGRCANDPRLALLGAAGQLLGEDDDDGLGDCPRFFPGVDAFARLAAGSYYLSVHEDGDDARIDPYTLAVRAAAVDTCGNGVVEGLEGCDDGNAASGDGCSAGCAHEGAAELEPNDSSGVAQVVVSPARLTGRLEPNDRDVYAIDVPDGAHLLASLAVEGSLECPAIPGVGLRLIGTDGLSVLASNADGGRLGNCGRLAPDTAAATRGLSAGRYFVEVFEVGARVVGRYFLTLRAAAPGCGNAVLEGAEQCDDGNTADGDGCGGTCLAEHRVASTHAGGASIHRVSGAGGVFVRTINVADGAGRPAWAPLADRIAVGHIVSGAGTTTLFESGSALQIATLAGGDPQWSADGSRLLSRDDAAGCARILDLYEGGEQCLAEPVIAPTWDPSAARYAFLAGGGALVVRDLEGGRMEVAAAATAFDFGPGGRLAFTAPDGGGCALFSATPGGPRALLVTGLGCASRVAWSPGGDAIAFGTGAGLYVLPLAASTPVDLSGLTALAPAPAGGFVEVEYSRDGRFVGFSGAAGASFDLSLAPVSGGAPIPVLSGAPGAGRFRFAP